MRAASRTPRWKLNALIGLVVVHWLSGVSAVAQSDSAVATGHGARLRRVTPGNLIALRDVRAVRISPDGRSIAYQVHHAIAKTNTYRATWYVVGTNVGGRPVQVADGGDPRWSDGDWLVDEPEWSPDSRVFAFTKQHHGEVQLWVAERTGRPARQLTRSSANVLSFRWSLSGERIFFTVGRSRTALRQAVRYAADNGVVVTGALEAWKGDTAFTPLMEQQGWEDLGRDTNRAGAGLRVYNIATHREQSPTPQDRAEYERVRQPLVADAQFVPSVARSPNGRRIAFAGFKGDSGWALYVKPTSGGGTVRLTPLTEHTLAQVWWSGDGREVWFTQDKGNGQTGLFAIPANGGLIRELQLATTDFLNTFSFAAGLKGAACIRQNATSPPEVAYVNPVTGEVRTLTDLNPEFRRLTLGSVRRFYFTNEYGDSTFGDLVLPPDYVSGRRYPLVVTTYTTREFLRGGVGDEYPIQPLAAHGFAVLSFQRPRSYAGPLHSKQSFDRTVLNWKSPMASLKSVVRLLADSGYIDPERTGLTGLSNGAEITLFTITHSNVFQAAATSGGSARDPVFYYLGNSAWHEEFDRWGMGGLPEEGAAKAWQELSPALNAEQITAPLLMQVAGREFLDALQLYTRLKHFGKAVELIVYPDEDHVKRQPKHRLVIYQRNIDWFQYWLQGYEDPDTAKVEQYARWRGLRKLQEQQQITPDTGAAKHGSR